MLGVVATGLVLRAIPVAGLPTSVPPCIGDCDANQGVTVDEILVGVAIALGQREMQACIAFDRDGNEQLTVDELVSGVDAALNGCREREVEGPILTAVTLARADDVVTEPATTDELGRPVFVRAFGSGFSLIVEARKGLSGADVGRKVFTMAPLDREERPDIHVIVSAALGDGSPTLCDNREEPFGGVPAAVPFGFYEKQGITDVINELSCRVDSGARTSNRDACTLSERGNDFGYAFVAEGTEVQFCLPFARAWAFPVGDTVIAVQVLDELGNPGEIGEIVVRVLQPAE